MEETGVITRLWLSIVALNIVNLSSIIFGIKYRLDPAIDNLIYDSQEIFDRKKDKSEDDEEIHSQLDRIRKQNLVKIAILGDKAYWVIDNVFYESDISDGMIDNENARPVDAYKLSEKEFVSLLMILDNMNN